MVYTNKDIQPDPLTRLSAEFHPGQLDASTDVPPPEISELSSEERKQIQDRQRRFSVAALHNSILSMSRHRRII